MPIVRQLIVTGACLLSMTGAAAAFCGDGVLEAGEQCDLGVANCEPGLCCETSCDSDCTLIGRCTDNQACCVDQSECNSGEGCCGNGIVEGSEQCDDGNRVNGDCCSDACTIEPAPCVPMPAECAELGSTNVIGNPSVRRLILRDSRPVDGQFDLFARDRFVLPDGLDIDPDTEIVALVLTENAGDNTSRELYRGILDPAGCNGAQCFTARAGNTGLDKKWEYRSATAGPVADAPGWDLARLTRNLGFPSQISESYTLRRAPIGPPTLVDGRRRVRLSVVLGDVCISRLLDCERNNRATRFICREIHCDDGTLQRGEQCGEPGLSCRSNKVCDACRCVRPLP